MNDDFEIVRGTGNPFRDVGLPDSDTKLIKADVAAEIVRVMRARQLTGTEAAKLAKVQEADISRVKNADLSRFTIDRLVNILGGLDGKVMVTFRVQSSTQVVKDRAVS